MKFRNKSNGYEETISVPWLWTILFGGLYFIAHGAWATLIIWIVLIATLYALMGIMATALVIMLNIIMAALSSSIIRAAYLRKGWEEIDGNSQASTSPIEIEDYPCPFCAEKIKKAAIKCKHCGSTITPEVEIEQTTGLSEEERRMESHGITFERGMYRLNGIGYDSLDAAIADAKDK